ncbi:oligosaccharide flippase family protein, partial [Raoultella planticola]
LKSRLMKVFFIFLGISVLSYFLNFILGKFIINLFFSASTEVSNLLRIMIVTQFIISLSMILVNLIIIPSGFSSYLKRAYLYALIFYFSIVYPMVKSFGVYGVALSILLVELLIVTVFYLFIKNKSILK